MLTPGQPAPAFERKPVFGLPVRVPARSPLVLCFVRGLESPFSREALARLQQAYPRFDVQGVQVAAVTDSALRQGQDFVPRHHLLFPLICDPEGALFEAYAVGGQGAVMGRVRALARGNVRGAVQALRHGHGPLDRRQLRLPAQFVVADGQLRYAHYADTVNALPDVDALLAAST